MVVRQLQHNKEADLYPIAFVDDDRNKQNWRFIMCQLLAQQIIFKKL